MIYTVFTYLLEIWGYNLTNNKAFLILRLATLLIIVSIKMEKWLSLFLHLIKCL